MTELDQEKQPLLSLCIIVGDEGAKTLTRLLRSVLVRPGGPMAGEIIIGWNGSDDAALARAVVELFGEEVATTPVVLPVRLGQAGEVARVQDTPLLVLRQKWTGNFAEARQQTFEAASGVWRMYLDTDDVVCNWEDSGLDGRQAIEDSLKWYGVDVSGSSDPVGPAKTRQDYLRSLAPNVNCVEFPYDYTIGGDGKSLWRYWRRRIVRWADGWVWHAQLNYHEDLIPVGGNVVSSVRDGGCPIRHYPSQDVHERTARNRAILQTMLEETKRGRRPVDGRLLYNCATFELQSGNWLEAEKLLDQAIKAAADDADMRMYRHCRAKALIALGRYAEAVYEAAALNGHDATAFEGWAILTECSYNRGEWPACIEYGRHVLAGKVRGDATDKPVERQAHTRVMMATAHLQRGWRGDLEDALHLAGEAVEKAPQDALSKDCLKRVQAAKGSSDALEAALSLAEYHAAQQDMARLRHVLNALPHGSDAPGGDLRVAKLRAVLACLSEIQAEALAPLPVFLAPSPWARYVGSLVKREGWKTVVIAGRPHLDDLVALRRILPEVVWAALGDGIARDVDATVMVDLDHTFEYNGERCNADITVVPASGVVDPARRAVLGLYDIAAAPATFGVIEDLRLVTPSRPDADIARIICRTSEGGARKRVDFFCPHWAEIWGPDALTETGCGGSEEAVIYLTRELVKLGYAPHVYGPWRPPGGLEVRDGVWWHDIRTFNPVGVDCPLVAHRAPWILKDLTLANRPVYIWHHDHEYPPDNWTTEIAQRGRHLYVSKWQQEGLIKAIGLQSGGLYGVVVGNGVPREEFDLGDRAPPPREYDRVFYASQPQRGLLPLLQAWPLVLEQEPNAVLDVYYGWQTVEALARTSQPQLWDIIRETDRLLRETPRVNAVGRLPQARLSEAMLRAGVWAYPCLYPETSCCIGLRAAAAGCKLVYTKTAALPETMPDATYALEPDGLTTETFAAKVVEAIRDKNYPSDHVARMTLATCSWSVVASRVADALEGRT